MEYQIERLLNTIVAFGLCMACAYYAAEESLRQRKLERKGEGE